MNENIKNPLKYELIINSKYLADYSEIPLNYDFEDLVPSIYLTQQIWIKPILGEYVYDTLLEYVQSEEEIPIEWQQLLLQIYPLLAKAVVLESLPYSTYRFSEMGITKYDGDTSKTIETKELNFIQQNLRSQVEVLKEGLVQWLIEHGEYFGWTYDCCTCSCETIKKLVKPNKMKHVYAPKKKCLNLQ